MSASARIPPEFQPLAFGRPAIDVADIQPVPELYAGQLLTRTNLIVCNILVLLPWLVTLAGLTLAGFAIYWMIEGGELGERRPNPQAKQAPFVAAGLAIAALAGYIAVRHNVMFGNLYLLRVARVVFRSRPDAIVDPDDRAAEFIEITPRENWKKFMLDTAADTGFLRLDFEGRRILFEGDHERYRVPAGSVESGHVEEVYPFGVHAESDALLFVILNVRTRTGPREIPFTPRGKAGMRTRRHREDWAAQTLRMLRRLVGGGSEEDRNDDRPIMDRDLED